MARRNVLFVIVLSILILSASLVYAQKNINFATGGIIAAELVFSNVIYPDTYAFRANAGDNFQIDVTSTAFDPTLRVVGPDAFINLFSDGAVGRDPRLSFTAADSGYYIVIVSSFSGNAPGGPYLLSMTALRNSTLDVQSLDEPGASLHPESNERQEK